MVRYKPLDISVEEGEEFERILEGSKKKEELGIVLKRDGRVRLHPSSFLYCTSCREELGIVYTGNILTSSLIFIASKTVSLSPSGEEVKCLECKVMTPLIFQRLIPKS